MSLGEMYHYLFVELSVEQTREWPFVSSLLPLMLITFGYMYFILYAGPRFMKDRPPYELRTFILIYDVIQILVNLWFVKKHLSYGWFSEFSVIYAPSNPNSPNAIKLFDLAWWLIFLKLFDYVETCVFVLRKKQNQVSGLHVYHHVCNVVFLWYYLKYILDERGTFIFLLNCAVHVIMYTYYFIAAWSSEFQQTISPIKPLITKLQIVQFIVIIMVLLQILNPNCESPKGITSIFIGNLFIFLYLFYDFHKKSYTKLPKQKDN
ncbi:elongation of very long chain fatty acids protein AAEL008004 [Mycetomoellerius zeteki]|uniref:elongation of very long chain fatty acids protein AAEL008004 n=1 Tax=Mycetomoellerius zeteki TaxID=64791 RepID=UPI00084E5F0F|nr:PREDICTED: elongation of very long chain fatty acids protein AAEL008004-like [Trachymyrmex zeteki]